jgi:antirestriction protein ArdC
MKDAQEALVARVIEKLEQGVAPWVRPWVAAGGNDMPHNMVTGRAYNGMNVLQLWMVAQTEGYPTNEWATFNQIKGMNEAVKDAEAPLIHVRKGEHGTPVWFMQSNVYKKTNKTTGEDESHRGFTVKQFTVFNRAQVEGLPATLAVELQPFDAIAATQEYIDAVGATIKIGGDSAYFAPGPDFIQLPEREKFESATLFYATAFHELTHWTGHEARLDRLPKRIRFGDDQYAFEELVAELGSAFNCAAHGLPGALRHAEYLGHWITALKNDHKLLWAAGSAASKAVAFLDERAGRTDVEADVEEAVAA